MNQDGGRWIFQVECKRLSSPIAQMEVDGLWEALVLAVVSGRVEDEGLITGATLNCKRYARRLSVWISHGGEAYKEIVASIGVQLRTLLALSPESELNFTPHQKKLLNPELASMFTHWREPRNQTSCSTLQKLYS
mmetsp:Transcript_14760/g.36060  ORF Transcript_14760/g.36060 Transcript_14760/m.36060 type:complete len:135 (-) Transcript_14760:199-603(-)